MRDASAKSQTNPHRLSAERRTIRGGGVAPPLPEHRKLVGVTDLPTPRSTLLDSDAQVLVWCKVCLHQTEADLAEAGGRGQVSRAADQPALPVQMRLPLTGIICTSKYGGRPA
jgi:hypothetical protein